MIDKSMTLIQVLTKDRGCAPIFMSFGMHCLGCPHATSESIENACLAHGVSADDLVAQLNEYFDAKEKEAKA